MSRQLDKVTCVAEGALVNEEHPPIGCFVCKLEEAVPEDYCPDCDNIICEPCMEKHDCSLSHVDRKKPGAVRKWLDWFVNVRSDRLSP